MSYNVFYLFLVSDQVLVANANLVQPQSLPLTQEVSNFYFMFGCNL